MELSLPWAKGSRVAPWQRICLPIQVRSLVREHPLEEELATYSSTLAWEISWTEEPSMLQSLGPCRVGLGLANNNNNTPPPQAGSRC